MPRFPMVAAAAALIAMAPAPVLAQAGGYYSATPAAAPAKSSLVTRSTIWKCADGVCHAPKGNARDAIMCELVARELGTLTAFSANGAGFDADSLAKCNAKAR